MSNTILRNVGTRFLKRFTNDTSSSRHFSSTGVRLIKSTNNAQDPMDASISGRKTKLELDTKQFGMKKLPLNAQKRGFNVTNDLNITQEEVCIYFFDTKF
jgi:hypothetical protein